MWTDVFAQHLLDKYNKSPGDPISGREIMQVVGTDIFRDCFRQTFWVDLMSRKTIVDALDDGIDVLFITDMRFKNEIEVIKDFEDGKIVRIYRDIPRKNQIVHRSEREMAEIPDSEFDHVVHNDGDFDDLRRVVKDFLRVENLLSY